MVPVHRDNVHYFQNGQETTCKQQKYVSMKIQNHVVNTHVFQMHMIARTSTTVLHVPFHGVHFSNLCGGDVRVPGAGG